MTTSETPQSHDLNFKTILVENSWDAVHALFKARLAGSFGQCDNRRVGIGQSNGGAAAEQIS